MPARAKRPIDGIVLLDKPAGLSSNAALQIVKRLYQAAKAGHTGSLDPLASGLLPICLGEATKLSRFLLAADKTYRFTARLGATTSTGDTEGETLSVRPIPALDRAAVNAVLARFTGPIQQLPPMYSALKHQGQPLYRLARQGKEVERTPRRVMIHELKLLALDETYMECTVRCAKGTYIRTLAEDIGEALGCGAHVIALRRTGAGPYSVTQASTLTGLQERANSAALDALLQPMDQALAAWPALTLPADSAYYLCHGQPVRTAQAPAQGWVRLYEGDQGRFLGIGEILDDGRVAPRRLLQPG